jgi:hypothetical protein
MNSSFPFHSFPVIPYTQLTAGVDNAVIRYQTLLQLPLASASDKESVRDWVLGEKPLVRSESQIFLENEDESDIVALQPSDNNFITDSSSACLRLG